MIYTVTFNPAIDYVLRVENLIFGKTNRTTKTELSCGGKGINVSMVLKNLGLSSCALGFTAGFTGKYIVSELKRQNIASDFVNLKTGNSRINVKIKAEVETEINADGPTINEEDIDNLLKKLTLTDGDILVLAGNIPSGLSTNIYERIIEKNVHKKVKFIVDATGNLLLNVLKFHPFLVKPNVSELEELFQVKIVNLDEIKKYARKLQVKGAKNVLVSMGKTGALLLDEQQRFNFVKAPLGKLVNSVGAGDSMVAGFIYGYEIYNDYLKALKFSVCTGSATAFSKGLASKEAIYKLLNQEGDYNFEN